MRLPTSHHDTTVELADLGRLGAPARRTAALRVLLAAALVATLALLFVVARSAGSGRAAVFPDGSNTGVIALDMSASISGATYARVATTLRSVVAANQPVGLVMFSDTAYELLPPGSPPAALRQFVPFFTPLRYYGQQPVFGQSPWDSFMAGTRISVGLEMARKALRRAHVKHGSILLVSDLDDAEADQSQLQQEALLLRAQHVPVRIVPLFAAPSYLRLFTALFGERALVPMSVFTHETRQRSAPVTAAHPWRLILLGGLLVFLLAGNERWNGRLVARTA